MGQMREARKRRLVKYLSRLAKENPEKFRYEWAKRLASLAMLANKRAVRIVDDAGIPLPHVFDLVEMAMEILRECGQGAWDLEANDTAEDLVHFCCLAISKACDRRLYRLGNTWPHIVLPFQEKRGK